MKECTKEDRIRRMLASAKHRAKKKGLKFDLTYEYLSAIAPVNCPVFGVELTWFTIQNKATNWSPSLDRIAPEKGYVMGNVEILSNKANTIKNDLTVEELHKFAIWVRSKK